MTNRVLQQALIDQGLLSPPADGYWGPQSRAALSAFQELNGLPITGEVSPETSTALVNVGPVQIQCGQDLAGRIVRAMLKAGHWIACGPDAFNIVYVEGIDADGALNSDAFDQWNDRRILIEVVRGIPRIVGNWLATTEPGATYTHEPMNPGGAFRVSFGQYRAWQFGLHGRTQYPSLVQCGPVTGFRDRNKDGLRTGDPSVTGSDFGINQHHGWNLEVIGPASAGCLVGQSIEGHHAFMARLRTDRRYRTSNSYVFHTSILPGEALG